jgi:carboxymethylenebutenolidase
MCFDLDSRPPIAPIAGGATSHRRLELTTRDGERFAAFEALAGETPTRAAMLVLPDVRGLHPFFEELSLRFAEHGVTALALDYFGRTAGIGPRGDEFPFMDHVAQVTWPGVRADIEAAARHLASAAPSRALFSVGFCFGGRLAFLTATWSDPTFSGAIGFYGWPSGTGRGGVPAPADHVGEMRAPVLGLFGGADQGITPEVVNGFEQALQGAGVPHQLHSYPGAPHSFFDRKATEFAAESADAWQRVLDFVRSASA